MFYLRLWSPRTASCSRWLPRTHLPYRSSAELISSQWIASHSKTGKKHEDGWPNPIFASERVMDRKSVFQSHATELKDVALLSTFLDHLTSLPSLKRATHCMYAYRATDKSQGMEKLACGQSDGGESGSGDRLSRLLELSRCENVIVVVSRWYGGTQLGSDRWKRISEVAKEALSKGGFVNRESSTNKKKRK